MDVETLRAGYRAYGLGVAEAMLTMFDQGPSGGADWEVGGPRSGLTAEARLTPYDLFGGETAGWEIVRVEPNDFVDHSDRIVVSGHVLWRPKHGWNVIPVPFLHIWTLRERHPVRVLSYLDGIELSRTDSDA